MKDSLVRVGAHVIGAALLAVSGSASARTARDYTRVFTEHRAEVEACGR